MSNPICTVMHWYGNPLKRPLGYEYCNGDIIDIVTYPDLYGYLVAANPGLYVSPTQARLHDLRGEFLRGYDNLRGVDPNRSIGGAQGHAIESHNHQSADRVGYIGGWAGGWGGVGGTNPVLRTDGLFTPFNTTSTGINETRPRNICVSLLIKSTKNGEERPLGMLIDEFPMDYPGDVYKILKELSEIVDRDLPEEERLQLVRQRFQRYKNNILG